MSFRRLVAFLRDLPGKLGMRSQEKKRLDVATRSKVDEVVQALQAEDFTKLRKHFWLPLRWLLPALLLKKGFDLIRLTTGSLEHAGTPKISSGWLTSAYVPMRFKRAKLAMSLTLTPGGGLVGLKFVPQSLAGFGNAWQPPAYAGQSEVEEEDVQLGTSKLKVSGTLTLPRGTDKHPCVVMLAGSGPMDRDSTVDACKPFKDLALGLTSQGIATLRFDKVSFTHGSQIRNSRTFTLTDEYFEHALDAVRQSLAHGRILQEGVFVLGHSLGGYVAPQLVSMEPRVAGCILLAAPSIPMYRSALRQMRYFASLDVEPTTAAGHIKELEQQCELADSPELSLSTPPSKLPLGIGPAYWLDFRHFTPVKTALELKKPVLILQGGRDYQVTVDEDYATWLAALGGTPQVQFRMFDLLNHLFILSEEPSTPLDYDTPGNVHEDGIHEISRWIFDSLPCG